MKSSVKNDTITFRIVTKTSILLFVALFGYCTMSEFVKEDLKLMDHSKVDEQFNEANCTYNLYL